MIAKRAYSVIASQSSGQIGAQRISKGEVKCEVAHGAGNMARARSWGLGEACFGEGYGFREVISPS